MRKFYMDDKSHLPNKIANLFREGKTQTFAKLITTLDLRDATRKPPCLTSWIAFFRRISGKFAAGK